MSLYSVCLRIFSVAPEWHKEYPVYCSVTVVEQDIWKEWCRVHVPFLLIWKVVDMDPVDLKRFLPWFNVRTLDPYVECYPESVFDIKVPQYDMAYELIEVFEYPSSMSVESLLTELVDVQKKIFDITEIVTEWREEKEFRFKYPIALQWRCFLTPQIWYEFLEKKCSFLPLEKRYELSWYTHYERVLVFLIREKVLYTYKTVEEVSDERLSAGNGRLL